MAPSSSRRMPARCWWPAWGTEASADVGTRWGEGARCEDGRTVDALAPAAEEGRSHAAKRAGEGLAPGDPAMSEWGNPAAVMGRHPTTDGGGRAPGELKHLSTSRRREDSRSSGERNGRSPNRGGERASRRCCPGVERERWRGRLTPRLDWSDQRNRPGTAGRSG